MFTVKLMRHNTITLVEAERVHIFPAGMPEQRDHISRMDCPGGEGCKCPPQPLTNKIRGISVTMFSKMEHFYIGDDPAFIPNDVDLYECAFIENSEGATTERVYGQRQ